LSVKQEMAAINQQLWDEEADSITLSDASLLSPQQVHTIVFGQQS